MKGGIAGHFHTSILFISLEDQICGGYMEHCTTFLSALTSEAELERCGFAMQQNEIQLLGDDLSIEEEFAELFANSHVGMVDLRPQRHMQMLEGWPHSMQRVTRQSGPWEQDALDEFKLDSQIFDELTVLYNSGGLTDNMVAKYKRHQFHTTNVDQYKLALTETGFRNTKDFLEVVKDHRPSLASTLIVED